MNKTTTYLLIGGAILVGAYFLLKPKVPTVPVTPVAPVNPPANQSSVEQTAINDASNLLNNIL